MSVYNLLLGVVGAGATAGSTTLGVTHATTSPYGTVGVSAYPWGDSTGFGTKYTEPTGMVGSTNGSALCIDFNHTNTVVAIGHYSTVTTEMFYAYPWSDSTGFGTKYTNATAPNYPLGVSFNPTSTAISFAHLTTPFISTYPWDNTTGFGTKYANPATLPGGLGGSVTFSPDGATIVVGFGVSSPYIYAYPWSAGYGTKYADPATPPTGNPTTGVSFNPAGTAIVASTVASPYIQAYPWSAGFGTKYTNPATLPAGSASGYSPVKFDSSGTSIAVAHSTTPFVSAYPWSAGFGTKYANPATLPYFDGRGVAFN